MPYHPNSPPLTDSHSVPIQPPSPERISHWRNSLPPGSGPVADWETSGNVFRPSPDPRGGILEAAREREWRRPPLALPNTPEAPPAGPPPVVPGTNGAHPADALTAELPIEQPTPWGRNPRFDDVADSWERNMTRIGRHEAREAERRGRRRRRIAAAAASACLAGGVTVIAAGLNVLPFINR